MSLRSEVFDNLSELCEGTGVRESDIEVSLGKMPIWVRVHESPAAVSFYREVIDETPASATLTELLHNYNLRSIVFRAFWEDDGVYIRADIPAEPLAVAQLQSVLEVFEAEAQALTEELDDWRG
jgi:hypothetical protein